MKNYLARQIYSSFFYPFLLVAVMWVIYALEQYSHVPFVKLGVLPRKPEGLPGILCSVFIHGDLNHIASNTLPLLILGAMLFYFYKKIAKASFLWIWFVSGLWLWIGGRNNDTFPQYHIGASTLIYGLAGFLFFSGLFRRHLQLMVVSALVVFLYGSLLWGIFPLQTQISWEGHLFGAIAGVLVAYNYRKEGPQRRVYAWEHEEEDETLAKESDETKHDQIQIRYIYKATEDQDNAST